MALAEDLLEFIGPNPDLKKPLFYFYMEKILKKRNLPRLPKDQALRVWYTYKGVSTEAIEEAEMTPEERQAAEEAEVKESATFEDRINRFLWAFQTKRMAYHESTEVKGYSQKQISSTLDPKKLLWVKGNDISKFIDVNVEHLNERLDCKIVHKRNNKGKWKFWFLRPEDEGEPILEFEITNLEYLNNGLMVIRK